MPATKRSIFNSVLPDCYSSVSNGHEEKIISQQCRHSQLTMGDGRQDGKVNGKFLGRGSAYAN